MIQPPDDLSDDQIEVWQQALEYFNRAYQLQTLGDWAGAIRDYKRSIRLFPTAEAHTFLGWVYSFVHLFDNAIDQCKRAIAVDPSFGNPYNDIGVYLMELGRPAEAIPWFEQAIRAPRYTSRGFPHHNLGRVYERQGQWRKAQECYEQALRVQPDYQAAIGAVQRMWARMN